MAHHASAKKRIRRNENRSVINHSRVSRIRSSLRKVEEAIESGSYETAMAAFKSAMPELMRGGSKGVMHSNTVSRKVSRLNRRIKLLAS
ncbi:MAG: 30S ribosomal protein S20 [Rhodospirillaceae bacterium]|nr:30S ribosomal protein S20 [Rhodospirillaceae bacterium]